MMWENFNNHKNWINEQLAKKNIKLHFSLSNDLENVLHAYFECLCLQQAGVNRDSLIGGFLNLMADTFEKLDKYVSETECFDILKIMFCAIFNLETEFYSKEALEMFDDDTWVRYMFWA